jgi:L-fucose isomerase-like protein
MQIGEPMRNPKALVIPFRFREGYPDEIVDEHTTACINLLNEMDLDYDRTQNVVFPGDADVVKEKFNPNHYDFLILLIPTWIEPVLVMRAVKHFKSKPVIVWGAGTFMYEGERVNLGSIPGSGVVKGTLREHGIYHEYIYNLPGNKVVNDGIKNRILRLANVSRAISLLNESRIVTIGYLFGGMSLGDIDITKMQSQFGPELVELDAFSLINRMEKLDVNTDTFKQNVKEINNVLGAPLGNKLENIARMYSVLKEIVDENKAQALTIKCHFELSQEYGLTACIPLSVIGNSIVASCEADIPVVLTQLIMYYLSGGKITTYADVHEILEDRILVAACGFAPGGMCIGNKVIPDMPKDNAEGLGATFGDYITNKNYLKEGLVTIGRVLNDPDGGFTFHMANGNAVGDIGKVSEIGCQQYPFTEIKLTTDVDLFAQNMGSHHYAIVYENLKNDLKIFCKIKGIRTLIE